MFYRLSLSQLVFTLLLAFCPNEAFSFLLVFNKGRPAYWPDRKIHYRFSSNPSGYFKDGRDFSGTPSDDYAPMREVFFSWQNIPGVSLSFTEDSMTNSSPIVGDGHNTITWIRNGWLNLPFHPTKEVLALTLLSFEPKTGAITDADIYFNADTEVGFKWAVIDSASESRDFMDVQNVATHEIGHLLGLDHSSQDYFEDNQELAEATMYYASDHGETSQRILKEDDIRALSNLYGDTPPKSVSLMSANLVGSTSESLTYEIRGKNFGDSTSFVITRESTPDAVSRYREIHSSELATVHFEIPDGFGSGSAKLVAFNSPQGMTSFALKVISPKVNASDSGGCELKPMAQPPSTLSFIFLLLALVGLRKKLRNAYMRIRRRQIPTCKHRVPN